VPTVYDNFERSYSQKLAQLTFWPVMTFNQGHTIYNISDWSLDYVQSFHKISLRFDQ